MDARQVLPQAEVAQVPAEDPRGQGAGCAQQGVDGQAGGAVVQLRAPGLRGGLQEGLVLRQQPGQPRGRRIDARAQDLSGQRQQLGA